MYQVAFQNNLIHYGIEAPHPESRVQGQVVIYIEHTLSHRNGGMSQWVSQWEIDPVLAVPVEKLSKFLSQYVTLNDQYQIYFLTIYNFLFLATCIYLKSSL